MDVHVRLLDYLSAVLGFGFDSGFYVRFFFRIKIWPIDGNREPERYAIRIRRQFCWRHVNFLFRACYVLGLNSHPIPYHDRYAIARCDRDDSILNGDWSVLANNLNQASLNLSIFSDFLICDFHFKTDKLNLA